MFILYDLLYLLGAVFYLLKYLLRRKFHRDFSQRLGVLPKGSSFDRPFWIHAVSVGEVMALKALWQGLKAAYPDRQFILSTVTPTGNSVARQFVAAPDAVLYLPLDFSFIVRGVMRRVQPCAFIIAETELWPNLISYLAANAVPVIIVNARISERSFRGYRRLRFFFTPLLNKVTLFCVQTDRDAERLARLGIKSQKIHITGNMKFDGVVEPQLARKAAELRLRLGATGSLIVAGSTHPGEEEQVCAAYGTVLQADADVSLLIAPRHPERAPEVKRVVEAAGYEAVFLSSLGDAGIRPPPGKPPTRPVFILDSVGLLVSYYACADIVFVGGSLVRKGGHNILEPAALDKPVIVGPHTDNFRDITELFIEEGALLVVNDAQGLARAVSGLLRSPEQCRTLAGKAHALLVHNRGSTLRNVAVIRQLCVSTCTTS